MTADDLRALCDRVWFGTAFTLEVVDAATVTVHTDVRAFWPGGPRDLTSTARLSEGLSEGQILGQILTAAGNALVHELCEQMTIDGTRTAQPHPQPLLVVTPAPRLAPLEQNPQTTTKERTLNDER